MRVSAMQSGVEGVQRAERQFEKSADRLSKAFTVSLSEDAAKAEQAPDVAAEVVEQSRAVAAYKANLKTVQTADEVNGVVVELGERR